MVTNIKKLAIQVLTGRWLMAFASFLLMVTAGASYMFGFYSNDIKSSLGYDQTTLNLVSFSKDLGASLGLLSGLINEVSPPWVVLSIGAVLNFFGNFMVWLAVARKLPRPPRAWHVCLYIAAGANSHTFTNTGALVTCVRNFPESRGVVLGLLKGYTGISGAVIAQLYRAIYGDDTKSFLLFVAWLPSALSFAFLKTIRLIEPPNRTRNDAKVFYKFLYSSMCLAGFLLIIIILEKSFPFTRSQYGFSAIAVLLLLFLPLIIVITEEHKLLKTNYSTCNSIDNKSRIEKLLEAKTEQKTRVPWWRNALNPPPIGEDFTIPQALFSAEMLTLLLSTVCGLGANMTMMDNLGQIGASLGYPQKRITDFVSLTSIWNYLGQIAAGTLSELAVAKYKLPRPLFLTLILLFSVSGHLLVAFNVPNGLYAATVIVGFCFGALWPMIFTLISELFGLKYYSTLYNVGGMMSPLGLYLLNVKVAGYYYDKEGERQLEAAGMERKPGEALNCVGGECFRLSFIIISVVTLFGAVVSLVLVVRTREFYKGDIYKRFRVEEVKVDGDDDVAEVVEGSGGGRGPEVRNDVYLSVVEGKVAKM